MIWEKIKEIGFTVCAIAIGCSNLAIFIIIALQNATATYFYEDIKWILYTEITLDLGFIAWGIERLVKDLRREK